MEGSLTLAPSRAQSVRLGLVAASRRGSASADAEPSFAVMAGRLPSEARSAASAASAAEFRGTAAAAAAAAVTAAGGVHSSSVSFTGAQPAAPSVDFDWAAVAAEVEAAEALTEDWEGMSFAAAAAAAGDEDGRTVASMSMQGAELDAFSDVTSEAVGGASLRPGGAALARQAAHSVGGASVLSGEGSAVRVGTRLYVPSDILESDAGSVLGAYSPGPGTDRVGPPSEAWEGEEEGTEEGEGAVQGSEHGAGAAGGKEDGVQPEAREGHLALVREEEGAAEEAEKAVLQNVSGGGSGAEGRVDDGPAAMAGAGLAAVKALRRTSSGAAPAPAAAMAGPSDGAGMQEEALAGTASPPLPAGSQEHPEQGQQQHPQRQRPGSRSGSTRSSTSSVAGTRSKAGEGKGEGSTAPASVGPPRATSQRPPRSLPAPRPATTTSLPDDLECPAAVTVHARASAPTLPATPSPPPLPADQSAYTAAALPDGLQPPPSSAAAARSRFLQRSPTADGVYSPPAMMQAPDANVSYYSERTWSEGSRSGPPRRHPNGLPSRQPTGPPPGLPLLNELARRYPIRKAPPSAPYVSLVSGQLLVNERLHEALARGGPAGGGLGPCVMLPIGASERLPSRKGSNGALQSGWSGVKAGTLGGRPVSAHAFRDAVAGSGSGQQGRQGGGAYAGGLHPNVRAYLQHKQQLQQQHAAVHQQQLQQHQQQLQLQLHAGRLGREHAPLAAPYGRDPEGYGHSAVTVGHNGLARPGSTASDGVVGPRGGGGGGSGGLPRLTGLQARTASGTVEYELVYGNGPVAHAAHAWADDMDARLQVGNVRRDASAVLTFDSAKAFSGQVDVVV